MKYLHGYEKVVHDYNAQGLRVRTKYFDRGDSLIVKIDYKYDEQDRVSEENTFDSEEELIKKSIYRRPNDNLVEKSEYNSEGKLIKTVTSKYNKEGLLIERNNYSEEDKTFNDVKYKYDKQGRVIDEVTSTSEGTTTRSEYLQYNYAGDLSFHRYDIPSFGGDPIEFEAHYQYDENGNWIKRSVYSGKNDTKKTPGQITERKIYYY